MAQASIPYPPSPYPPSAFAEAPAGFAARLRAAYEAVFVRYWPYWAATLAAAILNIFEFAFAGAAWGVTTEFTRWGGHLLQPFGVDVNTWAYFGETGIGPNRGAPWDRTSGWIVLGMFGGALIGSLLSSSVRLRVPQQKRRLVQGFVGGVLGGFGARLAMGCNLGSFFSAIPQFSLHGWLFMAGLFVGTYLGVKLALQPWMMGQPERRSGRGRPVVAESDGRSIQPLLGWIGVGVVAVGLAAFIQLDQWRMGIIMLFGVGFGLIVERGRICFTNAFRELWITRQGHLARALALAMIVQVVGFAILIAGGAKVRLEPASLGTFLGGILFGVGIVMAGGCETGWMYRSVQGYVQLWMAGLGTIVGTIVLAYGWDRWGIYDALVAPYARVNLGESLGWPLAIGLSIAGLAAWYLFSTWWETRPAAPLPRPTARRKAERTAVEVPA
jgi:uncharacterized protein